MEPLEDSITDILGKALRGLEMSKASISLQKQELQALLKNTESENSVRKLALALKLQPDCLLAISRDKYHPQVNYLPDAIVRFSSDYGGMLVNSYLAWDHSTREAVAFDTGVDASQLLKFISANRLQLKLLLLTHSHPDHILELDHIVKKTSAIAWTAEKLSGAKLFTPGEKFSVGALNIETRLTNGHSPAGITYILSGLSCPVAIVGDALFAGSIGGPNISYADALRTCTEEILSLPDETVLCPGHGPLTTVKQEKASNPFFAV